MDNSIKDIYHSLSIQAGTLGEPAKTEASWYAMRVYMNKVALCRDQFNLFNNVLKDPDQMINTFPEDMMGDVMEYYAPFVKERQVNSQGKKIVVERPLIPSLFLHAQQQATGTMPGAGTAWQGKAISPAGGLRPTAHRHSQATDADVHDGIVGRPGGAGIFRGRSLQLEERRTCQGHRRQVQRSGGRNQAHQWRPSPHRVDRRGLCRRHHLYTKMFSRKNIKSYEIS